MGGRRKTGRVSPADRHAGRRLRQLRAAAGLTQQDLAALVGVSYQQVHKYESGQNRLTVGWVTAFAAALGCRPGDFFGATVANSAAPLRRDLALAGAVLALPPDQRRAIATFLEAFATGAPGAAGERQPAAEEPAGPARPMETSGVRPAGRDRMDTA